MDRVAATYRWGGGALARFNEALRDALDPNGILSPGRNGIWGRLWRDRGWKPRQVGMPREVKSESLACKDHQLMISPSLKNRSPSVPMFLIKKDPC